MTARPPSSPVRPGDRRRELSPVPAERVWATPEQVVRIAGNAELPGSNCYALLVVTAGWTGARWGELTGLPRVSTHLDDGCLVIDAKELAAASDALERPVPASSGPGQTVLALLDKAIGLQTPLVRKNIARARQRNPEATPAEVVRALERMYVRTLAGTGAAVGATAAAPAVGTGVAPALSAGEAFSSLELSVLFVLSVAEVRRRSAGRDRTPADAGHGDPARPVRFHDRCR